MALAAIRLGLNPNQAREAHRLPIDLQAALERARPNSLSHGDLLRALVRTGDVYLNEVANHDIEYANRLRSAVNAVTDQ